MANEHHEHADESYYLDQLCSIGISAAIGVVMFLLWYWNQLTNLHPKLWIYVMLGGGALIVLAAIRGVALWIAVGKSKKVQHPDHHHHHDHHHGDHDHHAHDHQHGASHEHAGCDHAHDAHDDRGHE